MSMQRITRLRGSTRMLPLVSSIVAAMVLFADVPSVSLTVTSAKIAERSEMLKYSHVVHYEDVERGIRETDRPRREEALYSTRRESSADELAAAVGTQNVGYRDTGNYTNEHPRQAAGDGWRDDVPGTPGMDYPNLDGIPVTSFTCMDKEPGGYYADVETGCQVFHVCNVGGVKSSFLCPPGSIFNQKYFVCDWWYGFDCQEAMDLYPKNPEANFSEPSEDVIDASFESSETTTVVTATFDHSTGEYSQESRIKNPVNPSNDLSLASNGHKTMNYLSPPGSRRMDETYSRHENNPRDYSSDLKNLKSLNNGPIDDVSPRAFSRNRDKSFKRKQFDRTMTIHDPTNDLASYVNYAYFQAGSNYNGDHENYNI